jgi:pSer/pThr/pTyr-binding forkhead associated (FHA) protein
MASIIVVSGPDKDKYYPLGKRTNVLGRDEALPIQILDPKVSRKHIQIRFDNEKQCYFVVDMKSKHGASINGVKIKDEAILDDNDYISIGETVIMFTLKDFKGKENALKHYKKVGERKHPTITTGFRKPEV